jgi:LDH2 family malate/lactate/ureidoglycolate dehydrogenase
MANPLANDLANRFRRASTASHIAPEDLFALARDAFLLCGVGQTDAETAAEIALYAQLHGSDSHGVVHLPLYMTGLLDGTINKAPKFVTTSGLPCCVVIDADRGLGLLASRHAIDRTIELAKRHGLGAAAVRNSSHFGVAGYYADRAAEQGLIGFAFTNASPAIAPTGAKEALLGTNPIGAAFPLPEDDSIVVDMATAVVARSRIRHMLALGHKTIPEGWALDPDGRPTIDIETALKGSLQAIGGPKGYALSLMVELLCSALSDGQPGFDVTYENVVKRPSGICQFFLVLNPDGFAGFDAYSARAGHIAERLRNAAPMTESSPPRLPGARGHAINRRSRAEGIAMFDSLRHALKTVADLIEKRAAPRKESAR